ncbi:MAG: hypothetical protein AAF653_03055 [Chloroflexota bacterium]
MAIAVLILIILVPVIYLRVTTTRPDNIVFAATETQVSRDIRAGKFTNFEVTATRLIEAATATSHAATNQMLVVSVLSDVDFISPTETPNQQQDVTDFELTATSLILNATLEALALAPAERTQISEQITQTAEVVPTLHNTRTAVALTRNPSITLTPAPFDLAETQVALYESMTMTLQATSTPNPKGSCGSTGHTYEYDMGTELNNLLEENNIESAAGVRSAIVLAEDCTKFIASTNVQITIRVDNAYSEHQQLTENILLMLDEYELPAEIDNKPVRLIIIFEEFSLPTIQQRWLYAIRVDTDYYNALNAYEEGLRGEVLIEALGGLLPY